MVSDKLINHYELTSCLSWKPFFLTDPSSITLKTSLLPIIWPWLSHHLAIGHQLLNITATTRVSCPDELESWLCNRKALWGFSIETPFRQHVWILRSLIALQALWLGMRLIRTAANGWSWLILLMITLVCYGLFTLICGSDQTEGIWTRQHSNGWWTGHEAFHW